VVGAALRVGSDAKFDEECKSKDLPLKVGIH
jgi:hypothetical protein